MRSLLGKMKQQKKVISHFFHDDAGFIKKLTIDQESSGTKALYIDLFFYYTNLKSGGVLILDEFDINLHPDILPHLIKLFTDNVTNPLSAQMLFTSHNAEILDILESIEHT